MDIPDFWVVNNEMLSYTPYGVSNAAVSIWKWREYGFLVTNMPRKHSGLHVLGPDDNIGSREVITYPPMIYIEALRNFVRRRFAGMSFEEYLNRMFPDVAP